MRAVYSLETSSKLVSVRFRAFPAGDLDALSSHATVLEFEKSRHRDLELICRSRRSAEELAHMVGPLFRRVVWKRGLTAAAVELPRRLLSGRRAPRAYRGRSIARGAIHGPFLVATAVGTSVDDARALDLHGFPNRAARSAFIRSRPKDHTFRYVTAELSRQRR